MRRLTLTALLTLAACGGTTVADEPSSTLCRGAVDDHYAAPADVPSAMVRACDYRARDLGGPCPEDSICALAVIADTGDYPGVSRTYR